MQFGRRMTRGIHSIHFAIESRLAHQTDTPQTLPEIKEQQGSDTLGLLEFAPTMRLQIT